MITHSQIQIGILNSLAFSTDIGIGATDIQQDLQYPGDLTIKVLIYGSKECNFYPEVLENYLSAYFYTTTKVKSYSVNVDSTGNPKYQLEFVISNPELLWDHSLQGHFGDAKSVQTIMSPELLNEYAKFDSQMVTQALDLVVEPKEAGGPLSIFEVSKDGVVWEQAARLDVIKLYSYPWAREITINRDIIILRQPKPPVDPVSEFRSQMYRRTLKIDL